MLQHRYWLSTDAFSPLGDRWSIPSLSGLYLDPSALFFISGTTAVYTHLFFFIISAIGLIDFIKIYFCRR